MACSPEQLASNRRNATRSTGPKTEAGKARSRGNALKHGLTGDGVALPDEDQAAVKERFEAFEADLKPRGAVAAALVLRAAMLSVRLERSARQEAAKVSLDMLRAEDTEADERDEEIARLVGSIAEKPAEAVRKLRRSAEGIDWLVRSWQGLKGELVDRTIEHWLPAQSDLADRLTGQIPAAFGHSRFTSLFLAVRGNLRHLAPTDWPELSTAERKESAHAEMIAIVDAEIAGLERARRELDREAIARQRAGAAARAIFDPSKEAILARKCEAAAERGFYRALKEIDAANAANEANDEPDATDASREQAKEYGESGSFFRESGWEPEFEEEVRDTASVGPDRGRQANPRPARASIG